MNTTTTHESARLTLNGKIRFHNQRKEIFKKNEFPETNKYATFGLPRSQMIERLTFDVKFIFRISFWKASGTSGQM